jgi:membrane associated rhomboid family serine protease/Flp pilus assembly protein TadD
VTGAISAMAIFVTFAIKAGRTDIDPFVMSSAAFDAEPWRLASSALPHGDWLHLIFNVVWLWVLGTKVEETWGHVATLATFVVLAVGSGAAEFAFANGGIGLSGVGYGLVGLLWILRKRDNRFRDAIDRNVLITFIAWGLLCVALTLSNVWSIGNIAHAFGLVLGMLLGYATARGALVARIAAAVVTALIIAACVVAGGWFRPDINFSSRSGDRDAYLGAKALEQKQYERGARHLRRALALNPSDAASWYNYGIALKHVSDPNGLVAFDAWTRAVLNAPDDPQFKSALSMEYAEQGAAADKAGDVASAEKLYRGSINLAETAAVHVLLGTLYEKQGKHADAEREFSRATALDPNIRK